MKIVSVIKLIRVRQWVKNLFIFVPPFFAAHLYTFQSIFETFFTFLAFSFVASSIYVINDYLDIEQDRLHPSKKDRPLASGVISKQQAIIILAVLIFIGFSIGLWLQSPLLLGILGFYFIMNIAYSAKLKHIAIVDIVIIATGFLLRIFAGASVNQIFVSHWLILLTFLLALILALGKRRGEFLHKLSGKKTRKVLDGYNLQFIDTSLAVIVAITIVCYIMYTISEEVMLRVHSQYLYFSTIFVLLGILRYFQQTFVFQRTESPTEFLLKDHFLQIVLLLWGAFFGYLLYFQ